MRYDSIITECLIGLWDSRLISQKDVKEISEIINDRIKLHVRRDTRKQNQEIEYPFPNTMRVTTSRPDIKGAE